jgi:GGDEF domain-containing protein
VLAPGLVRHEAVQLAQTLETTLHSLYETGATDMQNVAYIGLAPYNPGDASADLLMQADQALAQAEAGSGQTWVCLERQTQGTVGDDPHNWHTLLDEALNQGRFRLFSNRWSVAAIPVRCCTTRYCRACSTTRTRPLRRALPALAGALRLDRTP